MKKLSLVLFLATLFLLPAVSGAKVIVVDTISPLDLDSKYFAEGMRSWFVYREKETGGDSQIYGLCVVGKKDRVEIYFNREIEPRRQVSRREILRHLRSLIFPATLSGYDMADGIYKFILHLEKERQKRIFLTGPREEAEK